MIQIDMDMPDNCEVCPIKAWEEEGYVCPFSGIPALNIGRQLDCPLRESERKEGEWIRHKTNKFGPKLNDCIECSQCGIWFSTENLTRRTYCPNCGSLNAVAGIKELIKREENRTKKKY